MDNGIEMKRKFFFPQKNSIKKVLWINLLLREENALSHPLTVQK